MDFHQKLINIVIDSVASYIRFIPIFGLLVCFTH